MIDHNRSTPVGKLGSYVDTLAKSDTPLLGYLAWHSVSSDVKIRFDQFNDLVDKFDAPVRNMKPPREVDVFRRAVNDAKRLKVAGIQDETYVNYSFRDSGHDSDCVYKNLVAEVVDTDGHELGFTDLMRAAYGRESGRISWTVLSFGNQGPQGMAVVDTLKAEVHAYFDANEGILPAIQVREAARQGLEIHMNGVRVRPSGGVYFLPVEQKDALQALTDVYADIDNCSIHIIPLVDDAEQRTMLREAFEAESTGATTELLADITELQESGKKISAKKFMAIQERYEVLTGKMAEYQGVLSDSLSETNAVLALADRGIVELLKSTTTKEIPETETGD